MQKITAWSQLATLPIPPTLIEQIENHLLAPFDNQQQAEATRNQLTHAISSPEWQELIGDEYILTLTIVCDDGQGLYLLFHKYLPLEQFQENTL